MMPTLTRLTREQARALLAVRVPCPLCTNWEGAGSEAGVAAALAGHLDVVHHITTPPNTPTVAVGHAQTRGHHS